jgi:hypothetical protein
MHVAFTVVFHVCASGYRAFADSICRSYDQRPISLQCAIADFQPWLDASTLRFSELLMYQITSRLAATD